MHAPSMVNVCLTDVCSIFNISCKTTSKCYVFYLLVLNRAGVRSLGIHSRISLPLWAIAYKIMYMHTCVGVFVPCAKDLATTMFALYTCVANTYTHSRRNFKTWNNQLQSSLCGSIFRCVSAYMLFLPTYQKMLSCIHIWNGLGWSMVQHCRIKCQSNTITTLIMWMAYKSAFHYFQQVLNLFQESCLYT